MIQYQSTQYNSTPYNRHYKHSENFKKMIFGQSLATSPHHWLVILPISASNSGESEFLFYIKGYLSIFQKCQPKKNQVFDYCVPTFVLIFWTPHSHQKAVQSIGELTKVLDIPSSLVAEFFQQKRYLGVGRSGPWQEIPIIYSWDVTSGINEVQIDISDK